MINLFHMHQVLKVDMCTSYECVKDTATTDIFCIYLLKISQKKINHKFRKIILKLVYLHLSTELYCFTHNAVFQEVHPEQVEVHVVFWPKKELPLQQPIRIQKPQKKLQIHYQIAMNVILLCISTSQTVTAYKKQ